MRARLCAFLQRGLGGPCTTKNPRHALISTAGKVPSLSMELRRHGRAMSRPEVFLSHTSADKECVKAIALQLKQHGIQTWLDEWNLVPGQPWVDALGEALRECSGCIVFVGPGDSGPWHHEEVRSALHLATRNKSYRLVPVLLPGARREQLDRLPGFLANRTWVEFSKGIDDPVAIQRLVCGIQGREPGPPSEDPLQQWRPDIATTEASGNVFNNLPVPRSELIGRREELAGIAKLLNVRRARLLTLTGAGGIGKTRLAFQVGSALASEHVGGVFFVALAPLREWEHVELAVATVLGVREATAQSLRQTIVNTIGDRKVLLLMDNFEHVLPAAPLVSHLLAACPELRVVATSRERLRLQDELEFRVAPLQLAKKDEDRMEEICAAPAVLLFQKRAQAVVPDFRVTRDNALAAARICSALDGLPLALELVAPRLRVLNVHQLADRIERSSGKLSLLRSGPRDAPSRHQTLGDAIDWSYQMLTPDEQRQFASLSVFAGGFTAEAADEITGVSQSLELIESLLEKNLLQPQLQPQGGPRLFMLETVREFASEVLEALESGPQLRRRHAEWFARLAAEQGERLQGRHRAEAISIFSDERANLRVALRWALDQQWNALAESLALALLRFWEATAEFSEARQWLELALGRCPSARLRSALGMVDIHQGRIQEAQRNLRAALIEQPPAESPRARAETLVRLQWAQLLEGDYQAVESAVEETIAGCLAVGDVVGTAMAKVQRAMVRAAAGDHGVAREEFDRAIEILSAEGAEDALGWALNASGDAARIAGDLGTCEHHYQRALGIGERLGAERVRTAAMHNLGLAAAARCDFDEALKHTQRAIRVQVAQGRRDTLPGGLLILSLKHISAGRVAEGARLLLAAEQMNTRLGQRWEYSERRLVAIASESIALLRPHERATAEVAAGAMDEEQIRDELLG